VCVCNVWVCVCEGFAICGFMYGICTIVCLCGFCKMRVCVCLGFYCV